MSFSIDDEIINDGEWSCMVFMLVEKNFLSSELVQNFRRESQNLTPILNVTPKNIRPLLSEKKSNQFSNSKTRKSSSLTPFNYNKFSMEVKKLILNKKRDSKTKGMPPGFPDPGPNLYVIISGVTETELIDLLLELKVPLIAVIKAGSDIVEIPDKSDKKKTSSKDSILAEDNKIDKFWSELELILEKNKNLVSACSGTELNPYYKNVIYVLFEIVKIYNAYISLINKLAYVEIPVNEAIHLPSSYSAQVELIPNECVTVEYVLYCIIDYIDEDDTCEPSNKYTCFPKVILGNDQVAITGINLPIDFQEIHHKIYANMPYAKLWDNFETENNAKYASHLYKLWKCSESNVSFDIFAKHYHQLFFMSLGKTYSNCNLNENIDLFDKVNLKTVNSDEIHHFFQFKNDGMKYNATEELKENVLLQYLQKSLNDHKEFFYDHCRSTDKIVLSFQNKTQAYEYKYNIQSLPNFQEFYIQHETLGEQVYNLHPIYYNLNIEGIERAHQYILQGLDLTIKDGLILFKVNSNTYTFNGETVVTETLNGTRFVFDKNLIITLPTGLQISFHEYDEKIYIKQKYISLKHEVTEDQRLYLPDGKVLIYKNDNIKVLSPSGKIIEIEEYNIYSQLIEVKKRSDSTRKSAKQDKNSINRRKSTTSISTSPKLVDTVTVHKCNITKSREIEEKVRIAQNTEQFYIKTDSCNTLLKDDGTIHSKFIDGTLLTMIVEEIFDDDDLQQELVIFEPNYTMEHPHFARVNYVDGYWAVQIPNAVIKPSRDSFDVSLDDDLTKIYMGSRVAIHSVSENGEREVFIKLDPVDQVYTFSNTSGEILIMKDGSITIENNLNTINKREFVINRDMTGFEFEKNHYILDPEEETGEEEELETKIVSVDEKTKSYLMNYLYDAKPSMLFRKDLSGYLEPKTWLFNLPNKPSFLHCPAMISTSSNLTSNNTTTPSLYAVIKTKILKINLLFIYEKAYERYVALQNTLMCRYLKFVDPLLSTQCDKFEDSFIISEFCGRQ